jgi:serine/threonine protein kinase/formylglycine-generating enzyme required for sulfatase activity
MSHSSASAKGWEPPSIEELSAQLPQYQIEALLGRGGMGAVYKGRQTSLDRPVAIKILPLEIGEHDATYAQRFKNEARAMARLSHPGIVKVYDFGETSGGLLYFVMEFIEGTDVAKMIAEQGRLHSEHAMAITAHVCDALGYAHSLGILHRDIKPANIMVGYDGRVKVADFGLAKVTNTGESAMTRSGVIMGTLPYMAPESLVLGVDVDKRADIYAVGVMLYQMLTGKLPHGMFEMPSLQVKGLDPRYDKIVATALRDDRELRYSSAEALRIELDGILTQPVLKVEASAKEVPAALDTEARPQRPDGPPQPYHRPPARSTTYQPERGASSGWSWVAAAMIIAGGIGVFMKLSNRQETGPSTAATSVGNPTSTPPKPPQASVPPESTTVPPLATKTENPAPAPQPAMPAAAQPVTPAAGVAASPMPAAAAPSAAPTHPPLPPELAMLDTQFQKLQRERVTVPFESSLENLNKNYMGGIERAISTEKSAGRLDSILALEAEQKAVSESTALKNHGAQSLSAASVVPESDDEKTPASLKALRVIYREQFANLLAARAANMKALTEPLDKRLAALETELTKADRASDAKAVRAYREALAPSVDGGNSSGSMVAEDKFTNSLGMKFVTVPGTDVMFCIHETRYKDYAAYAAESANIEDAWKNQNYDAHGGQAITQNNGDHPVGYVSWQDAKGFCAWLSKREGNLYRLPTDEEWSYAVGLGKNEKREQGITPSMLHLKEQNLFPWGDEYPPRTEDKAGNYSDECRVALNALWKNQIVDGYNDFYPTTAPVMSFKPNKLGIYDLGGNVWEFCEDWYDNAQKDRVLRGGSWLIYGRPALLSSWRSPVPPGVGSISSGFRVVIVTAPAKLLSNQFLTTPKTPKTQQALVSLPAVQGTQRNGFTNSLGMKFVPVKGTAVWFCIHETRRQDYAAYADTVTGVNDSWRTQQRNGIPCGDMKDHPVVGVTWGDAVDFCGWLGKKEGGIYRLPTDEEWSIAVGLGRMEKYGANAGKQTAAIISMGR